MTGPTGPTGPIGSIGPTGPTGPRGLAGGAQFGNDNPVPGAGTLQLEWAGDSLVAMRQNRAGTITGASVQVNVVDASRDYNLSIRVNGIEVATLALPAGSLGNDTVALSSPLAAGDLLSAFLVRTAGSGASTFDEETAFVEIS